MTAPSEDLVEQIADLDAVVLALDATVPGGSANAVVRAVLASTPIAKYFRDLNHADRNSERIEDFARRVRDMACDAAQLIDAAKGEWVPDGAWSDWDAMTRVKLTEVLIECEKIISGDNRT